MQSVYIRHLVLAWLAFVAPLLAQSPEAPVEPRSSEPARAAAGIRAPDGLSLELFAAEPDVANPVAIDVDRFGRLWVAETFRQEEHGVPDNRSHPRWLHDDLKAQTVEDRARYYRKHYPEVDDLWTRRTDRIRLLEDHDGDGIADVSRVWATGFQELLDGTGAGLLHAEGSIYYTCIPHLWRLTDSDGDGAADLQESLHRGYGVRTALRGHDLHGLMRGPDDRLWFSIGDRGYHLPREGRDPLSDPEAGAVFRCELDGSGLEVFHTGLRNPQEIMFDDRGELWTVDNNSDAGDRARVIHLIEGGDSGWRMNYQSRSDRGPWMPEGWWRPSHPDQPAFLNAPIANLGSGPSGMFHDPGLLGLPEEHRGRFFFCDFTGASRRTALRSFSLEPNGAGWRLGMNGILVEGLLITDAAPGPDGAIWMSDWVQGWKGVGKGRIWRLAPTTQEALAAAEEVRALLAANHDLMPAARLAELLDHRDRRVRLHAQWALGRKGASGVRALAEVAVNGPSVKARRHGIWGLGVHARRHGLSLAPWINLLEDAEAEIRVQAARVLGEAREAAAHPGLRAALQDASPRVVHAAAVALGRVGKPADVRPLLEVARRDGDTDRVLRHGVVMGLTGIARRTGSTQELLITENDPSASVRRVSVLALRRLASSRIARFLDDEDPTVASEAALAIHDVPIPGALSRLADTLCDGNARTSPHMRRALSACDLLSTPRHAEALGQFAAMEDAPARLRADALDALAAWDPAPAFDRVLNTHRPRPARKREDAARALVERVPQILITAPPEVRAAAARAARVFAFEDAVPALASLAREEGYARVARLAAIRALKSMQPEGLDVLAADLLRSQDEQIRGEAIKVLAAVKVDAALAVIGEVFRSGKTRERQLGIEALEMLAEIRADRLLVQTTDRAVAGDFEIGAWLELKRALSRRLAEKREKRLPDPEVLPELQRASQALENTIAARDADLGVHVLAIAGGLPDRGERVFLRNAAVSCRRCHGHGDEGATDSSVLAGPRLEGVASRLSRKELLLSIVRPNAAIAEGYENVMIETVEGDVWRGRVVSRENGTIQMDVLEAGERERVSFPASSIEAETNEPSSMPTDLVESLSPEQLRDLVAWLGTLEAKETTPPPADGQKTPATPPAAPPAGGGHGGSGGGQTTDPRGGGGR